MPPSTDRELKDSSNMQMEKSGYFVNGACNGQGKGNFV
jgi:hypothetical protein